MNNGKAKNYKQYVERVYMTKVTLNYEKGGGDDKFLVLYLDGKRLKKRLWYSKILTLSPGEHTLRVRYLFWGSEEFKLHVASEMELITGLASIQPDVKYQTLLKHLLVERNKLYIIMKKEDYVDLYHKKK